MTPMPISLPASVRSAEAHGIFDHRVRWVGGGEEMLPFEHLQGAEVEALPVFLK
jgi:hypothetical protein